MPTKEQRRGELEFVWGGAAGVQSHTARPVFAATLQGAVAAQNAKAAALSGSAQPPRSSIQPPPIADKSGVPTQARIVGEPRPRGREQPAPGEDFPEKPELCEPTPPLSHPWPRTCRFEYCAGQQAVSSRQGLHRDWHFRLHRRRGTRHRRLRLGTGSW